MKTKQNPIPQRKKFVLKKVTITITQTKPECYMAKAMESKSPLYTSGSAAEVANMFKHWLKNTFECMEINGVDKIKITVTR